MSSGTRTGVPAIDFVWYLMPITYEPGVGTVNDAPEPPLISVPAVHWLQLPKYRRSPDWCTKKSAALMVLIFDSLTTTTWLGAVVVIFVQKKNTPGLMPCSEEQAPRTPSVNPHDLDTMKLPLYAQGAMMVLVVLHGLRDEAGGAIWPRLPSLRPI